MRSPDKHWDPLLVAVAAYILVAVSNLQLLIPFAAPLRLGILTSFASVALFVMSPRKERRLRWLRDTATLCLLALLLWSVISAPFALFPGLAWVAVKDGFTRTVLLYVVMLGCLRGFRDLERLTFVHFAGIVIYSGYTLAFTSITAATARVEHIAGNYDPNDFATFAASGAPLALYYLGSGQPAWKRIFSLAGVALIATGVVLSGSRGGFLAFLTAGGYVLFRYDSIPLRVRLLGVAAAILAVNLIASDAYWARMATILNADQDYNVTDDVGRTRIWKRGIGYAMQRPLVGVGIANFSYAEATISPLVVRGQTGRYLAPHNSFVQVVAELGFPGMLLFLSILLYAVRSPSRGAAMLGGVQPRAPALAQALTASMMGLIVGVFFLSHGYNSMLFASVALAVGMSKIGRLSDAAGRASSR